MQRLVAAGHAGWTVIAPYYIGFSKRYCWKDRLERFYTLGGFFFFFFFIPPRQMSDDSRTRDLRQRLMWKVT